MSSRKERAIALLAGNGAVLALMIQEVQSALARRGEVGNEAIDALAWFCAIPLIGLGFAYAMLVNAGREEDSNRVTIDEWVGAGAFVVIVILYLGLVIDAMGVGF